MVSGAPVASDQHSRTTMSQPSSSKTNTMKTARDPKIFFICCTAVAFILLFTNSASAASGEVKTFQQLRSRGQSGEQYRSRVVAENLIMMTKTSPVVPDVSAPVAVTEVYGRDQLQMMAPTNGTVHESPAPVKQPEMSTGSLWASRIRRIVQSQSFQRLVMANFLDEKTKKWRPTGNDLWDGILADCTQNPSLSCMQKNMYSYLDRTLMSNDVNVTDNFLFIKNQVNYTDELIRANEIDTEEDFASLDSDPESQRRSLNEDDTTEAESPLEEVTNAMYDKTRKFALTHDIQLKLPKMMFDGAILRISPRSFEGNGALVKIELEPDTRSLQQESHGMQRSFILKKIKKIFKNKLLLGFLAVVFVIKLIKIKLLWLLPFLIGYGAAKKLVLKVLLFFFPALAHIFKLCSWYHHNYHHGSTKLHHHNHHISHTHTVMPPWFDHHGGPPHGSHESPTLIYTKPPTGHPSEYIHGAGPAFEHYPQDWELSGPGLGAEYISNRKSHEEPKFVEPKDSPKFGQPQIVSPPATSHSLHTNPFTQSPDSKYVPSGPGYKNPTASRIAAQYQAMPDPRQNGNSLATIDPFYGPILTKIDTIFGQLGVNDEPCKERLLCSMYKNPTQYSPHSNFISAELSRDASELKRAPNPNIAVTRFYRYIQAARDGQDHRDCLNLYNMCTINTEQRRK